jgi:Flp pilus assembly protein TadD
MYLGQGRWAEVEAIAARLESNDTSGEGVLPANLRGHLLMARKDWSAARQLLETAIEQHPRQVALRVLLSRALLEPGRDGPAAERALRQVLELDPDNREARNNLETYLRRFAAPA